MPLKIQALEGGQFQHFLMISIEEIHVYFAVGMGQAHYFFQKGNKVIWLAIDHDSARETIRALIGKIR